MTEPKEDSSETGSLFGLNIKRKRNFSIAVPVQLTVLEKLDGLKEQFEGALRMAIRILYEEVYEDLDEQYEKLLTKHWLKKPDVTDTICATIVDYYSDHQHLRQQPRLELQMCILLKYIAEYLTAIRSRRLTSKTYEQRCKIARKLLSDVGEINRTFRPVYEELTCDHNTPKLTEILVTIAEMFRLKDKGMLALETAAMIRKYPDVPVELLFGIIDARDDITSNESWDMVNDCMQMVEKQESDPVFAPLFQMSKVERKTSQILKSVMPRLKRRVKITMAD